MPNGKSRSEVDVVCELARAGKQVDFVSSNGATAELNLRRAVRLLEADKSVGPFQVDWAQRCIVIGKGVLRFYVSTDWTLDVAKNEMKPVVGCDEAAELTPDQWKELVNRVVGPQDVDPKIRESLLRGDWYTTPEDEEKP